MRIKVFLSNGDVKYHNLTSWLSSSEIYGWLNDTYGSYGWTDYDIIN